MGSLEIEDDRRKLVITQISIGGFDNDTTAKGLFEFLEAEIGMVYRCRLKRSWTPLDSYPNFDIIDTTKILRTDDYERVQPHAFVHFASPDAVIRAVNSVGKCELFMDQNALKLSLGPENSFHIDHRRRTTKRFKFSNVRVEIGNFVSQDEFFVSWKGPLSGIDFIIDPFDGSCRILFTEDIAFSLKGMARHPVIRCNFKVEFFVKDIREVKKYKNTGSWILMFELASSPCIFYRTADDDIYDSVPFDLLDDEDPWIRTTDFTPGAAVGRCNSYQISIPPRFKANMDKAMSYLEQRRIPVSCSQKQLIVREEPEYASPRSDPFFCIHHKDGISFEILFLVNAVVHKGIFNQHQMSDEFFEILRSQSRVVNVTTLRHICSYKHPVFNACKRLKSVQQWLSKNPKLMKGFKSPDDNVEVRRLVITPTKAYCLPPELELANRVLRKYKEVADRFLRVTFMDEGLQQLNSHVLSYYVAPIVKEITSNSYPQKTSIFYRVKAILTEGFYLCGRRYSFLAFSSNQLRDRSAWFFAENQDIRVTEIKAWMGKFTDRNVAKCTARMGLCFSSTYATVDVPFKEVNFELPDIERNGYVFSDGIGMLTPDLAKEVAEKLQLAANPPCAYQIRYAGCKGVIACWEGKDDGIRLSIRPSMIKFQSGHTILEIVSWTRFQPV